MLGNKLVSQTRPGWEYSQSNIKKWIVFKNFKKENKLKHMVMRCIICTLVGMS